MEACAPDLEWLRAQNSYHAPGVRQGAANLTIPARGQVGMGIEANSLAKRWEGGRDEAPAWEKPRLPPQAWHDQGPDAPPGPAPARTGTWRRFQLK